MITKVLLIDDLDEHEIFSHALRQHDRKISCVALACIESLVAINFLPDVIFLDMNMPKEDGLACLRKLKETEKLKEVPVYMYSTAAFNHREREAFQLGALKWIT